MAGADDDDVMVPHDTRSSRAVCRQLTVTRTSVGLVTMSKTAERFCDWATSASISSSLASASM